MECTIVSEEVVEISLVQTVSAGFDAPARDANRYETLNLHTHLIERPNSSFLLEVSGDSMVEAGINSGDTIVVDRSLVPRMGDIVVATLDGDFTVKYYRKDQQGRVCLEAGNKTMYTQPVYPQQEMQIVGVVLASFRKYR
jgi:SOS-response transcriptional repressor LexA